MPLGCWGKVCKSPKANKSRAYAMPGKGGKPDMLLADRDFRFCPEAVIISRARGFPRDSNGAVLGDQPISA